MTIPVVIFTYDKDAHAAFFAAESAVRAGLGPVYLAEDSRNPLPAAAHEAAGKRGYFVVPTSFPRGHNLRGIGCVLGMIRVMEALMDTHGVNHLVKLDSDTVIVRADRIVKAVEDDVVHASARCNLRRGYGACYVTSRRNCRAIHQHFVEWGGLPGHCNIECHEDLAFAEMADTLHNARPRVWTINQRRGFLAGWQYGRAKVGLDEYARRFDVVTFGNRELIDGTCCTKNDRVAAEMHYFLTEILPASK